MADNVTSDEIKAAMETQVMIYLKQSVTFPSRPGSFLPTVVRDKLYELEPAATFVTQVVDFIPDYHGQIDFHSLELKLNTKTPDYMSLPVPFAPKNALQRLGIPWKALEYLGMLISIRKVSAPVGRGTGSPVMGQMVSPVGMLWISLVRFGMPCNALECLGMPWNALERLGVPWNALECVR